MDTVVDEVEVSGSVVTVSRPAAWRTVDPPLGVVTCAFDAEESGFRPNVTVTVDQGGDADLDQRIAALEKSLDRAVVIAAEWRDDGQAVTAVHEHSHLAVVSVQRYVSAAGGAMAVVTYTCSVEQYPRWFDAFRALADASGIQSIGEQGGDR